MFLFAVIRLVLWAGIWWVLTLFDVGVMLAGVLAALIAMLISILFLNRVRDAVAMRWKAADDRRRERHADDVDEDAEAEDSFLDAEAAAADGAHGTDVDRGVRLDHGVTCRPRSAARAPGRGSGEPVGRRTLSPHRHRHRPSSSSSE